MSGDQEGQNLFCPRWIVHDALLDNSQEDAHDEVEIQSLLLQLRFKSFAVCESRYSCLCDSVNLHLLMWRLRWVWNQNCNWLWNSALKDVLSMQINRGKETALSMMRMHPAQWNNIQVAGKAQIHTNITIMEKRRRKSRTIGDHWFPMCADRSPTEHKRCRGDLFGNNEGTLRVMIGF